MNPSTTMPLRVRGLLSAMMFFQFMMLAVWFVPLAAYLDRVGVGGMYRALILSSMAIGCLFSPIVGMIADRHFAGQKVLAALNAAGAALLIGAAMSTEPEFVFGLLLLQMICYMPTWGLTSAIAMAHAPAEKFPQIRVFGSIGWVASGLCSVAAIGLFGAERFDGTSLPMYCGAGLSVAGALLAMVLPDTPPPAKGQQASVADALGLRAFALMKDFQFAVLIVMSLLAMIPFAAYWSYGSAFLQDKGFEYITVTMNWGQAAELGFMLLVPVALAKLGLRWTMMLGLAALVGRYGAFWAGATTETPSLYFAAILMQGLIYGFFFVGGQIYIDRKAPPQIRAQAQGMIFLVTFGVGLLLGNFLNEWLIQHYVDGDQTRWEPVWRVLTLGTLGLLVAFALLLRNRMDTTAQPAPMAGAAAPLEAES